MRMRGPFTSQIPLLISIEFLMLIAFALSILALFGGSSTPQVPHSAILIFNIASLNTALAKTYTTPIPDWYSVHYLSICSGSSASPTNGESEGNIKNIICTRQISGYTFNLTKALPAGAAELSSSPYITTTAPFILLILSITLAGITLLCYFAGIIILIQKSTANSKPPLLLLRIAFLSTIAATILLTNSMAKITSKADHLTGSRDFLSEGRAVMVSASMGWEFYVVGWLSDGFLWVALGVSILAAFRIGWALEREKEELRYGNIAKVVY